MRAVWHWRIQETHDLEEVVHKRVFAGEFHSVSSVQQTSYDLMHDWMVYRHFCSSESWFSCILQCRTALMPSCVSHFTIRICVSTSFVETNNMIQISKGDYQWVH